MSDVHLRDDHIINIDTHHEVGLCVLWVRHTWNQKTFTCRLRQDEMRELGRLLMDRADSIDEFHQHDGELGDI